MLTANSQFDAELRKLIEAEIERRSNDVSLGFIEDFSAYKKETGVIAGLRLALSLCDDANTIMQER